VTQFVDPLGNVVAKASRHRSQLVIGRADIGEGSIWDKDRRWVAPWRASARSGAIYRERRVDTPRSRDRHSF
jgi:hypothetical protein